MLAHAEHSGLEAATLCAAHGVRLKRDVDGHWPSFIDVAVSAQRGLLDDVAARLGDPALGARLGMMIPRGSYGLLEFAAHSGPDLRSIIDVIILTTPLVSPVVTLAMTCTAGRAHLHHVVGVAGGYGRQAAEMSIASIVAGGRRVVGDGLVLREAWFAHRSPSSDVVADVEGLLACPVRYGAEDNGFSFDLALLGLPSRVHDQALHAYLLAQAEHALMARRADDQFVRQVEGAIEGAIGGGLAVDTAHVARHLAVSPRTLQRRLSERGQTLSRLHDRVRERLARSRLLTPGARVDEVAQALGFADVSAFSRAFRRWTGAAPSTFRDHGDG